MTRTGTTTGWTLLPRGVEVRDEDGGRGRADAASAERLIAALDRALVVGSDNELVALRSEAELEAGRTADPRARERLSWRLERLSFVLRALDL